MKALEVIEKVKDSIPHVTGLVSEWAVVDEVLLDKIDAVLTEVLDVAVLAADEVSDTSQFAEYIKEGTELAVTIKDLTDYIKDENR